jgi:t-SNARE complex subunit (syntaxin)
MKALYAARLMRSLEQMRRQKRAEDLTQARVLEISGARDFATALLLADVQIQHNQVLALEQSLQGLRLMFVDLQALVLEQSQVLDSIESHVNNTAAYVEEGTQQIRWANSLHSHYRSRLLGLCLCLCLCAIVVVVPIVMTFKK